MTLGKNFRLPLEVRPTRYRADLRVDLDAGRFEGQLMIDLTLAAPRSAITLHAVELDVKTAVVEPGDDAGAGAVAASAIRADAESETVTLTSRRRCRPERPTLRLAWSGRFSPGLRGLYRAGGLAVTQFEAADARRLFPCFDEPSFKAIWQITLDDVAPGLTAISNAEILSDEPGAAGRRRIVFAPTPLLSSYLVALIIGDLVPSEATSARGMPIRTWSVPEKRSLTGFAQRAAAAVLPLLEDYFGLPYPFGKLDQIGVPDFEAGAMENAGAITFREVALLLDVATAPLAVQKRVAEVITHELAHQWFGNLVTMVWWDDLWLNEAFATWMAYKIVDAWRPEWRIWMDFEMGKGSALVLDALQSAHPIRADVRNAEEAGESFDAITYEKGGAVLRMIEGFLREDRFREGIRLYMRRHREGNATADDLWGALGEASGQPIVELANGWIRQIGYPLVALANAPASGGKPRVTLDAAAVLRRSRGARDRRADALAGAGGAALPRRERRQAAVGAAARRARRGRARGRRPDRAGASPTRKGAASSARPTSRRCSRGWCRRSTSSAPRSAWAWSPISGRWCAPARSRWRRSSIWSRGWAPRPITSCSTRSSRRLSVIEHRHVDDDDRARLHAFIAELFAAPSARARLARPRRARPRTTRRACAARRCCARACCWRASPTRSPRPRPATPQHIEGGAGALDPNLLDVVVTAAARSADEARFEDCAAARAPRPIRRRSAASCTRWRASRRRRW